MAQSRLIRSFKCRSPSRDAMLVQASRCKFGLLKSKIASRLIHLMTASLPSKQKQNYHLANDDAGIEMRMRPAPERGRHRTAPGEHSESAEEEPLLYEPTSSRSHAEHDVLPITKDAMLRQSTTRQQSMSQRTASTGVREEGALSGDSREGTGSGKQPHGGVVKQDPESQTGPGHLSDQPWYRQWKVRSARALSDAACTCRCQHSLLQTAFSC